MRRASPRPSAIAISASGRRSEFQTRRSRSRRARRGSPRRAPSPRPGRCAPVRVASVERGLHQRRVRDRTRDALGLVARCRLAHLDPADPGRALAVGHHLEGELEQDGVEQAGGGATPASPVACSSTVSLVLICPSTVIRSNEPATAARSAASGRRSARRSARSRASSRTRARSCPRPSPVPTRSPPPALTVHDFGALSVVMIALVNSRAPGESAAAASSMPGSTSSVSGTPITPVSATATEAGATPSAAAARRASPARRDSRARRSPRWRCPS